MATLELRDLSKIYPGGVVGLAGLDLSVLPGEFLTVVGPSGSGKSTLLRLVAGLDRPDSGSILIDGRPAADRPPHLRDVAMVFQNQSPYPHLSVFENLAFGLRARRAARAEIPERVRAVAAGLGLADVLDRRPATHSGGQRLGVALGRALARRPKLLLLDEPFSNLDAPLRLASRADLLALHRSLGITTIQVTHDQSEALALGYRVAVLNEGRLAQVGTPEEVYSRPEDRFVASFLGEPPMNFLRVEVLAGEPADDSRGSPREPNPVVASVGPPNRRASTTSASGRRRSRSRARDDGRSGARSSDCRLGLRASNGPDSASCSGRSPTGRLRARLDAGRSSTRTSGSGPATRSSFASRSPDCRGSRSRRAAAVGRGANRRPRDRL